MCVRPLHTRGVARRSPLWCQLMGGIRGAIRAIFVWAAVGIALLGTATHAPASQAGEVAAGRALGGFSPAAPVVSTRHLCGIAARGMARCHALLRTDVAPRTRAQLAAAALSPVGYGPSDLLSAYGLGSAAATSGAGETVAIIAAFDSPTAAADLATYRSQFVLPACASGTGCFRKVDQNGGTNLPVADVGWSVEIALDIEMVSAICPACSILLVEANSPSSNDLGPAVNTAVRMGAAFVSNSYGGSEVAGEDSIDAQYFDHPGVVITASSGDAGYGVLFPAASPHVIAVGGTTLSRAANARGWVETAWSGAGSGCSAYEPKPAWQQDTGCPNRTVADVAAVADPATGVALYAASAGGWVVVGGTSAAAPIVAAADALAGHPAAGTYPAVYPYVRGGTYDVTSGSTGTCGSTYLCTAMAGYDGPTGLGTPHGTAPFSALHAPGAPMAVSAAPGDAQVDVSWSAPASDGGTSITSYLVSASSGNHTCSWASGPLSCVVGGLVNGTAYSFRVTATTIVGTSSASAWSASATPRSVPDRPATVTATPGDASAHVSWLAPASDGGSAITGYAVTSSPDAKTCATSGALACTVSGLTNDTSYTFTVTAMNIAGTSSASAPSDPVTPRPATGSTYHAISPTRLLDTRIGNGLSGTFKSHLARTFQVTGRGGVPSGATAVTGNLTVTGQTQAGYLFVGPVATNSPSSSTLNFPKGDDRANGVVVALGAGGTLSVTYVAASSTARTQAIFDVTGYFTP